MPMNRARQRAMHESSSQKSDSRCMVEQQDETDNLNEENGESGGERLCLNSVASSDRADNPVDENNDPGNCDQEAEDLFCGHRNFLNRQLFLRPAGNFGFGFSSKIQN